MLMVAFVSLPLVVVASVSLPWVLFSASSSLSDPSARYSSACDRRRTKRRTVYPVGAGRAAGSASMRRASSLVRSNIDGRPRSNHEAYGIRCCGVRRAHGERPRRGFETRITHERGGQGGPADRALSVRTSTSFLV